MKKGLRYLNLMYRFKHHQHPQDPDTLSDEELVELEKETEDYEAACDFEYDRRRDDEREE